MIPFIHIGPLSIPAYGLMVALGMICAAYIFQADFDRRGIKADAFTMITIAALAGIIGSKVYSALESLVADLSMNNELLREKIHRMEAGRPLVWRRSKP